MTIREFKINKNKYQFCNEGWSNSNGWGHRTILLRNGYQLGENKIRYYNRTWERYEFQSCMSGCVWTLKHEREEYLKNRFKEENNLTRLTKTHEKEYNKYLKQDELLKEYTKLYNLI